MKNEDVIEDSLLEIWSHALPKLPSGRVNKGLTLFGTLVFACMPFLFPDMPGRFLKAQSFFDLYAQLVATLLGLTIAGFTIFITSYSPKFVIQMWRFKDEETGFSMYKAHLLNFVSLLLISLMNFVWVLMVCFMFRMIDPKFLYPYRTYLLFQVAQFTFFAISGYLCSALVVQVKAMIYNFYNLSMIQMNAFDLAERSEKR